MSESERSRRPVTTRALVILVTSLAVVTYWRAVLTFFAVDDFVYLGGPAWTMWQTPFEFFAYPRGLAEAAFAVHRHLFGNQHALYHVFPLGLHIVNALLVYRLIRRAMPWPSPTARQPRPSARPPPR